MTWVLILQSPTVQEPPAVIGGYETREEAEKAGELATEQSSKHDEPFANFNSYTVIPGAALHGPVGSTHSKTWREADYTTDPWSFSVGRKTVRFP